MIAWIIDKSLIKNPLVALLYKAAHGFKLEPSSNKPLFTLFILGALKPDGIKDTNL